MEKDTNKLVTDLNKLSEADKEALADIFVKQAEKTNKQSWYQRIIKFFKLG